MIFTLLQTMRGIITDRNPEMVEAVLELHFENAPNGAVAIIDSKAGKYYRPISDGISTINKKAVEGLVNIEVILPNGSSTPPRWRCEPLVAVELRDGSVWLAPDDSEATQRVAACFSELADANRRIKSLEDRLEQLQKKVEGLYEAYDLV